MKYDFENQQSRSGDQHRLPVFFPLLLAGMLALGVLLGYEIRPGGGMEYGSNDGRQKLDYILRLVEANYVDTVNSEQAMENAIRSYLYELDPHSVYMDPSEAKRATEEMNGNFGGVGIQFIIHKDTLMVTHLVPGGPAGIAGIKPYDRIIKVDTIDFVKHKPANEDVVNYLRGMPGTRVKVTVWRRGKKQPLLFSLQRGMIPVSPVEASVMLNENTGLIRVSQFGHQTHEEFKKAAENLLSRGMKTLILDLRDNGGGLLDQAQLMADELLKGKQKVVITRGRTEPETVLTTHVDGILENTDVIILVNHNTASASEIVAGAIQDNDRGLIVGRRTFGKGLVQREFNTFKDKSLLRLTVARYYTPTGRCIQKPYGEGIDYFHEQMERYNHKEFFQVDSSLMTDSLKYLTLYKKRPVYGGGGIMPDVFVPLDTHYNNALFRSLLNKKIINEFAFDYTENNRKFLSGFKNENEFARKFTPSAALLNEVLQRANEKGITFTEQEKADAGKMILCLTVAEIARLMFNSNGYMLLRVTLDDEVKAALLHKNRLLEMIK